MEYAPGGSLSTYLAANVFTEDVARFFFQQLIFAVRYCHHMNVANRDVKLENTLLDADKKLLKLCDFGLSKDSRSSLCKTRVGTPNYLAPEIVNMKKGGTYDGKAVDIWSCGVVLYVMLFRSFPFERECDRTLDMKAAMLALMERIVKSDYSVPSESTVSASCLDLLGKILTPDPAQRITVEGIINHPWYQTDLPPGADNTNYPVRPEEGLQVRMPSVPSGGSLPDPQIAVATRAPASRLVILPRHPSLDSNMMSPVHLARQETCQSEAEKPLTTSQNVHQEVCLLRVCNAVAVSHQTAGSFMAE
eukprot:evm.model.scf_1919.2 EVM.evm.TU.scf_1919.2   scf_1919:15986-18206(-)